MAAMTENMEGADCMRTRGATLEKIASHTVGPMAYVGMFATYRNATVTRAREDIHQLQQDYPDRRIEFLDARKYINEMHVECGTPLRLEVSDCVNTKTAGKKYHRCMGASGGHADLVAWDLIEFLWQSRENLDSSNR